MTRLVVALLFVTLATGTGVAAALTGTPILWIPAFVLFGVAVAASPWLPPSRSDADDTHTFWGGGDGPGGI